MSLTWNQFVHAPIRSLPRSALVVPLTASLLFHAALFFAIVYWRWDPFSRPARLTDAPPESVLTLAPPPQPVPTPVAAPVPPPPPPPPEPVKTPDPEPPANVAPDEMATPAPKVEEAPPAPPPEPVTVHVDPPTPPPAPVPAAPVSKGPAPVSFAGVEAARARRVVYVVDASGAMTSSLKFVKEELARSIARLDSSQSFQIVIFRELPGKEDSPGFELPPSSDGKLMAVTNESRLSTAAWLSGIQPGGRSDPLEGLTAALKMKPDLIFLLTRSIRRSGATTDWGAGTTATLNALDHLNPIGSNGLRRTVIKAIQFLDEDPTGLLPAIGEVHGDGEGSYKVLKLQEVAK
jgi:hypothetical protein